MAYGFKRLHAVQIQDLQSGSTVASPTHYPVKDNIVYFNEEDLRLYGEVVILHEVLHVALEQARAEKLITQATYNKISRINKTHFSDWDGYVGMVGEKNAGTPVSYNLFDNDELGRQKAYAFGYSFRLLRETYSIPLYMHSDGALHPFEKPNAVKGAANYAHRFFSDWAEDRKLSTIYFLGKDVTIRTDLHLMDNTSHPHAITFLLHFISPYSGPNLEIQPLYDACKAHG